MWMRILLLILFCAVVSPALARNGGPDEIVTVVYVVDGDTIRVSDGNTDRLWVRLDDIDAPELKGQCADEINQAKAAKKSVELKLQDSPTVTLRHPRHGNHGRVMATVIYGDDHNLNDELVKEGHARVYKWGKRKSWCDN